MLDRARAAVGGWLGTIADRMVRPAKRPSAGSGLIGRTIAGVVVTPDNVLQLATAWACVRYLTQTVGVLPWHVHRQIEKGSEIASRHPVDWLIWQRVSPEFSSFQFRETLLSWALRYGNGYAEIERDGLDRPLALWPLHPTRVRPCRSDAGALYYEVMQDTGGRIDLDPRDIFHLRGFGDDVVGLSVVEIAAQSLGWARAAQIFGAAFFGNGSTPTVVVRNKKQLKPEGLERQRKEFDQLYKGPTKSGKTAIVDNDTEIETIGLNAEEMQLISVHQYLVEETCRWFGVPPHKVMHLLRSTFNNIEHQAIEVVVDSVSPWVKRFEDEANFKLFGVQNRLGFYTKMNMNALLRGDAKSRMEFYKGLQFTGALAPNEIRELEDMNSLGAEGDIHVMQQQMVPLEFIAKGPKQTTGSATPPPPRDDDDTIVEDDEAARARAEFARVLGHGPAHVDP
ncbi:MAG: phage portal protein [Bauldia sp.]|nr:phage portal protein [Bauldia sp.]